MAEIGSRLCASNVIIRRRHAGGNTIHIGWSDPDRGCVLADERIENAGQHLVHYEGALGIAVIDFFLLEALISNAAVIPKVADERVVREIQVTLHGDHPTPVIFIESRQAVTEFLLEAIFNCRDVRAKRVER